MTRGIRAAAVLAALASVPAYAGKPQIQWNQEYDFEGVDTYQWQYTPETDLQQSQPFLHSKIKTGIEYYLTEAGLTQVTENPDVFVNYHTSTETEVSLQSNSYGYGFGAYGMGGWGYYGYGMAGPVSTTTRVNEYTVGTLIVDVWDAQSRELVWRGVVSDTVPDDIQKAEKLIDKALTKLVAQWQKMKAKAAKERAS